MSREVGDLGRFSLGIIFVRLEVEFRMIIFGLVLRSFRMARFDFWRGKEMFRGRDRRL